MCGSRRRFCNGPNSARPDQSRCCLVDGFYRLIVATKPCSFFLYPVFARSLFLSFPSSLCVCTLSLSFLPLPILHHTILSFCFPMVLMMNCGTRPHYAYRDYEKSVMVKEGGRNWYTGGINKILMTQYYKQNLSPGKTN